MALTWHHTQERLVVTCHDGSLTVHCRVCDSVLEVQGAGDVAAAREFCLAHRDDGAHTPHLS